MRKQCGPTSRVSGAGMAGAARLLRERPQLVVPFCVSTVLGGTLSEAEHRGLKGSLRKSATVQGQCGPISRANGHRIGSPGSGP